MMFSKKIGNQGNSGKDSKGSWLPFSSVAYGANAMYVPCWGQAGALELIVVMYQNFPTYKTHPALDVYHHYTIGMERFQSNYEFRVLGWQMDMQQKIWSFLYLPTERNDIRVLVKFTANEHGRLRMDIEMDNPSNETREWEFHLYFAPCGGLDLQDYKLKKLNDNEWNFHLSGTDIKITSTDMKFLQSNEMDSSFWINFPANAENSNDPDNPTSRDKKRLRLPTFPIVIPAGTQKNMTLECFAGKEAKSSYALTSVNLPEVSSDDLPYLHEWWEMQYNQQYSRSFADNKMTNRVIPARQWSCFYTWDAGMTAVGAVEMDTTFAEKAISEMPDPQSCGNKIFSHGSTIITALYALWELYQKDGDVNLLNKHYPLMRRLVLAMYSYPELTPAENHDGILRSRNNTCGVDDYPAIVYANGWPFAWDYKQTLPLNPDRCFKQLRSVGLTAHAIRFLKLLRLIAYVIGRINDIPEYEKLIDRSERALNSKYWDDADSCFYNHVEDHGLYRSSGLYDCLPLLSDSVDEKRKQLLLDAVSSPEKFWTPHGLTVVAQNDPCYRRDGYWNGAVWLPPQWFFWKAFYNMGEMTAATRLADNVLALWERNHTETLCCWEKFQVHDGHGCGNSRFSGLSAPILSFWRARRYPGRVQAGQDILIRHEIDPNGNFTAELVSPYYKGRTGISVVLNPETNYLVDVDGKYYDEILSDAYGYTALTVNIKRNKKLQIELQPT